MLFQNMLLEETKDNEKHWRYNYRNARNYLQKYNVSLITKDCFLTLKCYSERCSYLWYPIIAFHAFVYKKWSNIESTQAENNKEKDRETEQFMENSLGNFP